MFLKPFKKWRMRSKCWSRRGGGGEGGEGGKKGDGFGS